MVQSSSSGTNATHAMPVGWSCTSQASMLVPLCMYQHTAAPCPGACTVSNSCSVDSSSNAAGDLKFTIHLLSSTQKSQLHLQQNHQQQQQSQQAASSAGHSQPSRCTWPAFASLSANSQMGQLRWKQTATQPAADNSSTNSGSTSSPAPPPPQPQQQEDVARMQQRQQEDVARMQQQIERDVQQLAQDVFQKGQVLAGGRYKLIDKIPIKLGLADGRFTTIWHAKDTTTNKNVVLKCLEAGDALSYSAGMREAALHAAAGRCSNIVGLTDAFEHRSSSGRHPVMVLEPCGTNLLNVIALYASPRASDVNARDGTTISGICDNPRALKQLAKDTLTALNHLHQHGLVHMDLSPDNILLDKEFVSQEELHARALLPQGNFFKTLSTKWRLFQAMLKSGNQPDRAAQLEDQMLNEMQASIKQDGRYHEGSLHKATFKLTDFGRAVPYKDVMASLFASAEAAAGTDAGSTSAQQQALQRFNKDGVIVFSDPTYQPPEEILGLSYISPSYDMWKLGCLLFEAATDSKLFNCQLRGPLEEAYGESGFSDQHFLLDSMTTALGSMPREFGRQSPLYEDFFCGQDVQQNAAGQKAGSKHKAAQQNNKKKGKKGKEPESDLLLIHAGPLKATPGGKPLQALLLERTVLNEQEAKQMADFLSEVLCWEPSSRTSAEQMLQHAWLNSIEPLQEGMQQQQQK